MSRPRLLWLLWTGILLLGACGLPAQAPTATAIPATQALPAAATATPQPTPSPTASPIAHPATATPSPATPRPSCTLIAKARLMVYHRPSREAELSAVLPPGTQLRAFYRTANGWYGFDPGSMLKAKPGLLRIRWVAAEDVQTQGNCAQLTEVPPLPAHTCLLGFAGPVNIYKQPSNQLLVTLTPDDYFVVLAIDPQNHKTQIRLSPTSNPGWLSEGNNLVLDGPCDQVPHINSETGEALPMPTPSPTALAIVHGNEAQIRFAPGAVSWEHPLIPAVEDYIFRADAGQTIGVAVMQDETFAPLALAIQAPDGHFLQTFDENRSNWHGLLLQSGDYRLSVQLQGFLEGTTLQVNAYPPLTQHQQLADPTLGYTLFYDPTVFAPSPAWVAKEWKERTGFNAQCLDLIAPALTQNTDLLESQVCIGQLPIPQTDDPRKACFQASVPQQGMFAEAKGTWWVNGVAFDRKSTGDDAAGSSYGTEIFYTYLNNRCIALTFFTHWGNINNYDPESGVHAADPKALWAEFERLFFTLRWPGAHP